MAAGVTGWKSRTDGCVCSCLVCVAFASRDCVVLSTGLIWKTPWFCQPGAMERQALANSVHDLMRKVPEGVSVARVARAADMNERYIYELMRPSAPVRQSTVARIKSAIIRIRTGEEKGTGRGHAVYRSLLVVVSLAMGFDPVSVQMTDPRGNRTRNDRWIDHVFVHAVARSLMVTVFGFRQVEVARELGLTRAAVSKSVKQVADREDSDAGFARAMDIVMRQLLGEVI